MNRQGIFGSHDMIIWYLKESEGASLSRFNLCFAQGQRYGQAFFNALSREDQLKLRGTRHDTFYKDDPFDCYLAIAWLTAPR